jgi:phenylalanine-4-hydroxylase
MKDPSPTRIAFDLKRLVRTKYVIDSFEAHKVGA